MRRRIRIAFISALLAASVSAAAAADTVVAVTGGTVFAADGSWMESGTVLIRNGKIAAVGKTVAVPRGATVIDARGKFVLPGLVDAMSFFGIQPFAPNVPEPVTPENKIIDAYRPYGAMMRGGTGVQAEAELLCGGVTAVYIAPGNRQLVGGQGAVVKTGGLSFDGLIVREPASVDMALAYVPMGTAARPARPTSLARVRKALAAAREYRKSMNEFGQKTAEDKKRADAPDRDPGNEALALLIDGKISARIEADFPEDILAAVGLAEEFKLDLVIDGGLGSLPLRDILAKKKIPVVLGPLSRPTEDDRSPGYSEIRAMEDERLAARLAEAGVKIAISSHAADNGGTGRATQGRWLLLEAALAAGFGLPEKEALKAVTINAAEICGVAHRVGSLAPGKDADIVILSGHPLKAESRVEKVFIDGRPAFSREEIS